MNYTCLLNAGDDINIVKFQSVDYTHDPNIVDAFLMGTLSPGGVGEDFSVGKRAIFLPQQEYFYVKNIKVCSPYVSMDGQNHPTCWDSYEEADIQFSRVVKDDKPHHSCVGICRPT